MLVLEFRVKARVRVKVKVRDSLGTKCLEARDTADHSSFATCLDLPLPYEIEKTT